MLHGLTLSVSASGGAWSLTGNAGTDTMNNFIGTTDATDLVFKVNNLTRMTLSSNGYL